jgi:hypothetical protein
MLPKARTHEADSSARGQRDGAIGPQQTSSVEVLPVIFAHQCACVLLRPGGDSVAYTVASRPSERRLPPPSEGTPRPPPRTITDGSAMHESDLLSARTTKLSGLPRSTDLTERLLSPRFERYPRSYAVLRSPFRHGRSPSRQACPLFSKGGLGPLWSLEAVQCPSLTSGGPPDRQAHSGKSHWPGGAASDS